MVYKKKCINRTHMTIEFCAINKPEDWMEMVAE